jgi:acetylornithine deacetylase/succinyl-diaminopimelate desuccinylase-like protein
MRRWTRDLVAIDSVTGREGALADWLAGELPGRGWQVRVMPVAEGRRNLLCTFDGGTPRLLFNTHLDTVPDAYGPEEDSNRLYGRGTCDTKGILAAMLEAMESARDDGVSGLGLLLVVGEEFDHLGAKAAGELLPEPEVLIVGEPTENHFLRAQKGLLTARLVAQGAEGHSGYPERFDSAVDKLLPVLEALRRAPWLASSSADGTTLNISILEGGNAYNKVPGTAAASLMYRLAQPAAQIIQLAEECLAACPGKADGLQLEWHREAACDPIDSIDVLDGHACAVAAFGTDMSYFNWQPQKKFLVGPGSILQAHRDVIGGDRLGGEWIEKSAQEQGARLYRELIARTAHWHQA